eukprot:scaffold52693_cov19-Tisochrysis_lutea.AAC.1
MHCSSPHHSKAKGHKTASARQRGNRCSQIAGRKPPQGVVLLLAGKWQTCQSKMGLNRLTLKLSNSVERQKAAYSRCDGLSIKGAAPSRIKAPFVPE